VRPSLTDEQFARVSALLHDLAGLAPGAGVDGGRRDALALTVAGRLSATGLADADTYVLRLAKDTTEQRALLEDTLVGETYFWRNGPQMTALREDLLPRLMRAATAQGRRLLAWSAGCSSGEETYTLAMMLSEMMGRRAGATVRVVGSDISRRALSAAREGVYGARSLAYLDPARRSRWLEPVPGDRWRVGEELRALVEFHEHNLVTDPAPWRDEVDLVLCRNVTIYFERPTTQEVVARLREALRPGGLLVLGHSETLWKLAGGFALLRSGDAFAYRKDGPGVSLVGPGPSPAAARVAASPRPRVRVPSAAGVRPRAPAPTTSAAPGGGPRVAAGPTLLDQAQRAQEAGDYATAARFAVAAADANPLDERAHYLHGLALASQGRLDAAVPELRRAVFVDPKSGFSHFLLASVLRGLGDGGAAASYRAAADTLGHRPADEIAPELGGRSISELTGLCLRLAGGGV